MSKTYRLFFQTIGRKGRRFYLMAIPIVFLMSISEIVGIAVLIPFVCRLFGIEPASIPFLHYLNDINMDLSLMGLLVLFAYLLKILINVGAVYVLNFLAFSVRNILQRAYFKMYLATKIERKIGISSGEGEAVRDLTYEFNIIHNQFIVSSLFLIAESFVVILLGSILLVYATQVTFIMIFVLTIVILVQNAIFSRRMYRWGSERARMDGQMADLAAYSVKGAKEIYVNRVENRMLNELASIQNRYRSIGFKQVSTVSLPKYTIEAGAIASVIVFISINKEGTPAVVGELVMATIASLRLLPSFSKIAVSLQGIRGSLPSLKRVFSKMQLASSQNAKLEGPHAIRLLVESQGIFYRYQATSREIFIPQIKLTDFGLNLISGPSGSGKTTLFEIMLGMRDADIGDARQVKFSSPILMAQQTYIFSSTIRGALTEYETGEIDEEWLNQVVTACGLEEVVERTECNVGNLADVLSGGEFNRLALARALIPKPKLLLLDEATNGLDLESRERIYQFLKTFSKNALIIMISHDDVLNSYADNIIKLNAPEFYL